MMQSQIKSESECLKCLKTTSDAGRSILSSTTPALTRTCRSCDSVQPQSQAHEKGHEILPAYSGTPTITDLQRLSSFVPNLIIRELLQKNASTRSRHVLHQCHGLMGPDGSGSVPAMANFHGAVLIADVTGFTKLTELLGAQGPAGVELLTESMNQYFSKIINVIYRHGGDIIKFAGDSVIVLFHEHKMDRDQEAIRNEEICEQKTSLEDFPSHSLIRLATYRSVLCAKELTETLGKIEIPLEKGTMCQSECVGTSSQEMKSCSHESRYSEYNKDKSSRDCKMKNSQAIFSFLGSFAGYIFPAANKCSSRDICQQKQRSKYRMAKETDESNIVRWWEILPVLRRTNVKPERDRKLPSIAAASTEDVFNSKYRTSIDISAARATSLNCHSKMDLPGSWNATEKVEEGVEEDVEEPIFRSIFAEIGCLQTSSNNGQSTFFQAPRPSSVVNLDKSRRRYWHQGLHASLEHGKSFVKKALTKMKGIFERHLSKNQSNTSQWDCLTESNSSGDKMSLALKVLIGCGNIAAYRIGGVQESLSTLGQENLRWEVLIGDAKRVFMGQDGNVDRPPMNQLSEIEAYAQSGRVVLSKEAAQTIAGSFLTEPCNGMSGACILQQFQATVQFCNVLEVSDDSATLTNIRGKYGMFDLGMRQRAFEVLKGHIQQTVRLRVEAGLPALVPEFRVCNVLFIGFPFLPLDESMQVDIPQLHFVQTAYEVVGGVMQRFKGCLLQFRCDEKGYGTL